MNKITSLLLFLVFVGVSECCYCQHAGSSLANTHNTNDALASNQVYHSNGWSGINENFNRSAFFVMDLYDTTEENSSAVDQIANLPGKFLTKVNRKISGILSRVNKQSKKYIVRLLKQESSLKDKISSLDSRSAKSLFSAGIQKEYALMAESIKLDTTAVLPGNISGEYYPNLDSLQTALTYMVRNPQLINANEIAPADLQATLKNLLILQGKMYDADQLKQFIQQRKEQIKAYLSRFTNLSPRILKAYRGYNRQLYYYASAVKECRESLNDPDKVMKTSLAILNKVPAFSDFMKKNSLLAGIFNLNGTYIPSGPGQGLPGREQVLAFLQNQTSGGSGPNMSGFVQRNIQSAQGEVDQLRSKLANYGSNNNGADVDLPNFHPNDQKTKSFLKRLQLGTDLQTVHSSFYFLTTTNFGLTLGYKINNKNDVGIGASVKMGWGKDINHINVTGQGAGLRSFTDINIKKSFYATGGFEYNYQQPFDFVTIPHLKAWQESGLVGVSKKISLKTKFIKSMKTQLLWDFLSYQQVPRSQPLKFRVGYSF